ncbi:MAG: CDF family Co(II)/Ni(II) efflux transporter DmeF [Pseudomonadota bacterium]
MSPSQHARTAHACAHSMGPEHVRKNERRTHLVIVISAAAMVIEIVAGFAFGSMALLADGLHMATHVAALSVAAIAYALMRRHENDADFAFGVGKMNTLGGYTSAILLAGFAIFMAWESVERLLSPKDISYDQALIVAVFGLVVNAACAVILGHGHGHGAHKDHDHNLKSAYVHVIADALTSVFAIFALLAGKAFGAAWLDPIMGVVGSVIITVWAIGLLRDSATVLLDRQAPADLRAKVKTALEADDANVAAFHMWSVGLGRFALQAHVDAPEEVTSEALRARLPADIDIRHAAIEARRTPHA